MTTTEWNRCAALLDHLWPGEFTDADADAFYLVMRDYPARQVEAAITTLAATDQWRPNPARILATGALGEYASRRRDWRARFEWLQRNFGRAAAIAELDPDGTRTDHYPPEPRPGSTSALRSTPEQLAERARTYGVDLGPQTTPQLTEATR